MSNSNIEWNRYIRYKNRVLGIIFIILCVSMIFFIRDTRVTQYVLYGSYSYSLAGYTPLIKLKLIFIGFLWIAFGLLIMPNKNMNLISMIGKNTLPIFLVHGFFVKFLGLFNIFCYTEAVNILFAVIIAATILLFLGNVWVGNFIRNISTGKCVFR